MGPVELKGQSQISWIYLLTILPHVVHLQSDRIRIVGYTEVSPRQLSQDKSGYIFEKTGSYIYWDEVNPVTTSNLNFTVYGRTVQRGNGYGFSNAVCEDIHSLEMAGALGLSSTSMRQYMYALSKNIQIPYIELKPSNEYNHLFVINMHPHPSDLVNLTISLVKHWKWNKTLLAYEENTDISMYQATLPQLVNNKVEVSSQQLESDFEDTLQYMKDAKIFNAIIDCSIISIKRFLNRALDMQMLTEAYHYHFTSLDLHTIDLNRFSHGGANITWAQMVHRFGNDEKDMSKRVHNFQTYLRFKHGKKVTTTEDKELFSTHNALMVDSISLLTRGLYYTKINFKTSFRTRNTSCWDLQKWNLGYALTNSMLRQTFEGMTGRIEFKDRKRVNYKLMTMGLLKNGIINQTGTFTIEDGLNIEPSETKIKIVFPPDDYMNKVLTVTSIVRPPYFMEKESTTELKGNDRYEGFCVDLMKEIAKETGLRYEFRKVGDGNFGSIQENGTWDGMVGELLNKTADLVVAPLTIQYAREQVIDFTKPFMTFGISILYKVPREQDPPGLMAFAEPITYEVWGSVIGSLVGVSLLMYAFARFSPTEWENPFPCKEDYEYVENQFNMSNVFWFAIGSIMQQGCDIMPKGPATRIVAIAWWFFTLIIISSYTANLAAFLTITTITESFTNVEELAAQTDIKYGCQAKGTTEYFFSSSNIGTYKTMWEFMKQHYDEVMLEPDDGVNKVRQGKYAYIMESSSLQYQINKDCDLQQVGQALNSLSYGIGVQSAKNCTQTDANSKSCSPLRDMLSQTILLLNEKQVLLQLYNQWWKVKENSCEKPSVPSPQLKIPNLAGIFVFLCSGLFIALIVLCFEILIFTVKRAKIEKTTCCTILVIWLRNSVKGTFPNSRSITSLDAIETHSNNNGSHGRRSHTHSYRENSSIDETSPLNNGHAQGIKVSDTTDTFI